MLLSAACPPGGELQPTRREPPQDIGLEDWRTLLGAVKDRLRQIGSQPPPADPRAGVLECAAALEQLHMSLPMGLQRALYDRAVATDAPGDDAALRHDVARLL